MCAIKEICIPCRYIDLIPRCSRPISQLYMVKNLVIYHIFERFGYLYTRFKQSWLSQECLKVFADAVHNKGAALDNCWGFVDRAVRPICRPMQHQRAV